MLQEKTCGAPLYRTPYRLACMRLFMVSKGYTDAQLSTPATPPAQPQGMLTLHCCRHVCMVVVHYRIAQGKSR